MRAQRRWRARIMVALVAAFVLAAAPPALASHGPFYMGEYANSFVAGHAADGREVAVMAGVHLDFPYHHEDSAYDQLAVYVEGQEPVVLTGRPVLDDLVVELGEDAARLAYPGRFDLRFAAVEHTPRYQGDPAGIGDLVLSLGVRSERSPGFVYTPYELREGHGTVAGQAVEVHGQAEAGSLEAPGDPRFESAYDYAAAPTLEGPPYTYVGFESRALHGGADGVLGPYFAATASDEFTLEGGEARQGNPHGVPLRGEDPLVAWETDLGPGILHRSLVRLRDAAGRELLALSERIQEDSR